jgi:hypothetical protein
VSTAIRDARQRSIQLSGVRLVSERRLRNRENDRNRGDPP